MSDEKREPWLNYLALTTVVLAVCATLSTFKGSSYSTRAVLSQTQAANQWSYYQSKSIKGYLYEIQKEELETEIAANEGSWAPRADSLYRALAGEYSAIMSRYGAEKDSIGAQARLLEARRDHAQSHSQMFGLAVIFLQIGILLSSIAALVKQKPVWLLGLACGVIGLYHFAAGFLAR